MIIAFMNMKGGVGKTTLCVHLAGAASNKRKKVLIIDYDPQYNITQHLIKPQEYFALIKKNKTIYGVLQPSKSTPDPFNVKISPIELEAPRPSDIIFGLFRVGSGTNVGKVDLVPGSHQMMYLVLGKTDGIIRPLEERFHSFLEKAERKYDYVFIDCHPAGSFLTKSALMVADIVITPVIPDSYSQRGLALMKEFLDYLARFTPKDPQIKIVFNMIPSSKSMSNVERDIRTDSLFGPMCVNSSIHASGVIANAAQQKGYSWARIVQWSRKSWSSRVRREITLLFEEIFGV